MCCGQGIIHHQHGYDYCYVERDLACFMERVRRMGRTTDSSNGKDDGWNKVPENRGEYVFHRCPVQALGDTIHVVFCVNLANWSTALGGAIYIEYNMNAACRVVHGWQR